MTFNELKELVATKIKDYPQYKERALLELRRASWMNDDGINIADMILNSDKSCDNRYVLPFFLGKTSDVDLTKPLEIIQIKEGGSGGLDIDTDFEPIAKEEARKMLIEKYGQNRVMSVAAYGTVGLASAIKDVLRKAQVPFAESNNFCKNLNSDLSFDDNMKIYKEKFPDLYYNVYEKYKTYLDMVPKMIGQINHVSVHAGGCVVLDEPVWKYCPVVHTKDGVATAFVENGSNTELDELGITKYDFLAISVLETISNAVDSINEELIMIEDDDGVVKIVSSSYVNDKS